MCTNLHVRITAWLLPSIPTETVVRQSKDYGLWNGVDLDSKLALALTNYLTCPPGACLLSAEQIIPVSWVKMTRHAKGSVTLLLQLGRKAHVHALTREKD